MCDVLRIPRARAGGMDLTSAILRGHGRAHAEISLVRNARQQCICQWRKAGAVAPESGTKR